MNANITFSFLRDKKKRKEASEALQALLSSLEALGDSKEELITLLKQLNVIESEPQLRQWRALFNSSGVISSLQKNLKTCPPEEKRLWGQKLQPITKNLQALLTPISSHFEEEELLSKISKEHQDATLPFSSWAELGGMHPITALMKQLFNLFSSQGFQVISGPELEEPYYNFDALGIEEDHPARDGHDTFYLNPKLLLRTHTSNMQIRFAEEKPLLPFGMVSLGRVYRRDSDATHSPMFHQMEVMVLGKDINLSHLKYTLEGFLKTLLTDDLLVRYRPSYFPFTEPSFEVDISCLFCQQKGCNVCKNSTWLEVLGSGMVHPTVLQSVGLNPKTTQGFAFGAGIERLLMLKDSLNDMRMLYDGHPAFLRQFQRRDA